MRNKNDGVALAAIVAKETVETNSNGAAAGLAIASAGIAPLIGIAAAHSATQTARAKDFAMPEEKPEVNFLKVYSLPIKIMLAGILLSNLPYILDVIARADGDYGFSPKYFTPVEYIGYLLLFVAMACAVFISPSESPAYKDYAAKEKAFAAKEAIYNRLRYVEADHVVFDPVTGKEAPANESGLLVLLGQN